MVGTLPQQFFDVRISTIGENLAQLMLSVMMTGDKKGCLFSTFFFKGMKNPRGKIYCTTLNMLMLFHRFRVEV